MRIVVNSAFLTATYSEGYTNFLFETFKRITTNHPDHEFVFVCESQSAGTFNFGNNVKIHSLKQRKNNVVILKYWYDIRIPYLLRKYKADLFFSPGNLCSVHTKVKQCVMVNDFSFLKSSSHFTKTPLLFYKKHMVKSIRKANEIIVFSAFTKKEIIRDYEGAADKVTIIYNGITNGYGLATDEISDETKKKYTGGKDFFLYAGSLHPSMNLVNLLKAFSLFKKRQQSSLKLVICSTGTENNKSFVQLLNRYKYRSDVILSERTGESAGLRLLPSAYAMVYPVLADDFSTPLINAMQSGIPVITSVNSAMQEITDGAALYVNPGDPADIAAAMMRLYKDEKLRNELIEKGRSSVLRYNWDKSAGQLWKSMQKAAR